MTLQDQKKTSEKNQIVKEIAGKDVGLVPATLCGVFRDLLESGKATNILWYTIFVSFFISKLKLIKNSENN